MFFFLILYEGEGGPLEDFLFCVDCSESMHQYCIPAPVSVTEQSRLYWRCADCKICENCKKGEHEESLLVCDLCDRGYHTFCLATAMKDIPEGRWLCAHCVRCKR